MPVHDWQFWVVTAAALVALLVVLRPFLPARKGARSSACPGCGPGQAAARARKTQVTVSGRKMR